MAETSIDESERRDAQAADARRPASWGRRSCSSTRSVVNVALPAIQDDLGGGLALQQWVVDAYLLTLGSLILVGGSLGDLFGGKTVFLIGARRVRDRPRSSARSPGTATSLIVARAAPGGRRRAAHAGRARDDHRRLQRRGARRRDRHLDGLDRASRSSIGPLVGGWLVTAVSWRAHLPDQPAARGRPTLALDRGRAPRRPAHRASDARVDMVGGILCVLGLAGPVFALIEAPTRGFGDPLIVVSLVGGIVALRPLHPLGAAHEPTPMLPLGLFRLRNFTFANLETFTVYAGALDADASSSCSSCSRSPGTRRSGAAWRPSRSRS